MREKRKLFYSRGLKVFLHIKLKIIFTLRKHGGYINQMIKVNITNNVT